MAQFDYIVKFGATYGSWTTATNVQNVTMNIGRRKQLDQYNADTASVTIRYPTGYASPDALFVVDTWVVIYGELSGATAPSQPLFTGRISDVNVQYGIPYVSSVGNADYVTLSCEGLFAALGRAQGNSYSMAADTWHNQTSTMLTQTGINCIAALSYGGQKQMSATTISNTWADWVNKTLLSVNGRIATSGSNQVLFDYSYNSIASFGNFSDTTNNATNHAYNQIEFSGFADNYYTQVTVSPEGFSSATVQTGSAPYRTLFTNTLNASTAQATDLANFLLATYKTATLAISAITCNLNMQQGQFPPYGNFFIGEQVSILFRGTTYNCIIEGSTWSGTPNESNVTYYVSGADLNNVLILDNTVYGKLDSNRLGY